MGSRTEPHHQDKEGSSSGSRFHGIGSNISSSCEWGISPMQVSWSLCHPSHFQCFLVQTMGSRTGPISVDLYDAHGIGLGASGAAAGILHPCSPKGKVVYKLSVCFFVLLEQHDDPCLLIGCLEWSFCYVSRYGSRTAC